MTRNRAGAGEAWYAATVLDGGVLKDLLRGRPWPPASTSRRHSPGWSA